METDDAHARHLVLPGSANLVGAAHDLGVVVVVVLVTDGDEVGVQALELQPD
jgi:hypothetical protein